jgi:hypothetical protein
MIIASRVSANSRFPAPRMIGDTHQVIHVDEVAVGQGLHEAGAAVDEDVGALLLLELGHLLGRSPLTRCAFHSSGSRSVEETTYLGMPLNFSAYPYSSDCPGHASAKCS